MKILRCRDAGFDCDGVLQAANEAEILAQAAQHAQTAHQLSVTPELVERIKKLIHDDSQASNFLAPPH